jgi:polygalacturonase
MSDVRDFGATGDGTTDDTQAILHAIADGEGGLTFSAGIYRISQTIEIDLDRRGFTGLDGANGTAKIIMSGAGPAFRLLGNHEGTGAPASMKPNVWSRQRMPTIQNLEIEGAHPQADGVQLIGTVQALLEGVLIRRVRHGIHLTKRNRNVLISHCHVYHNLGVGIYLEKVNLHQIIIASSHISYNRLGGIRLERSEVRNLQITGNGIEYNNHRSHGTDPEPTAEIYVDTTAEGASVNEVTVASNTIQATSSPGGANIRIIEQRNASRPPGLWTITGNIIGSQENNLHLTGCHGIVISGNFIYSCTHRNLLAEHCSQLNLNGNSFRRHDSDFFTGLRFEKSQDCVVQGCTVHDELPDGQPTGASLIELVDCRRMTIAACQLLDGVPHGLHASGCSELNISGCTIRDTRAQPKAQAAVRIAGASRQNLLLGNLVDAPPRGIVIDPTAQAKLIENMEIER